MRRVAAFLPLPFVGIFFADVAFAQNTIVSGIYNSSPPSLANKAQSPVQLDASGRLIINCGTGCSGGGGGGSSFGSAFPSTGTAIGLTDGTDMQALTGINYTGTKYAAAVDLVTAIPAGANTIGAVTQAGTWSIATLSSITSLPALAAGSNTIGAVTQAAPPWSVIGTSTVGTLTGLAVNVQDALADIAQASTTSGQYGHLALAAAATSAPTTTAGSSYPFSMTTRGAIRSAVSGGGNDAIVNENGNADGTAATNVSLYVTPYNIGYNGSTWDRLRTVGAGATGLSTGVLASALYGYNGSTWDAVKDDASKNLNVDIQAGVDIGATGATVPASAVYAGGNGVSAEPSKGTTGYIEGLYLDLTGKLVTSPYSNRENQVGGSATATGTAATTIIGAGGAGVKTYVTDIECGRTDAGTTAAYVTFSDSHSAVLVLPNSGGGGGHDKTFETPLVTAAATAFTFTSSASISTIYCSAQGYFGY